MTYLRSLPVESSLNAEVVVVVASAEEEQTTVKVLGGEAAKCKGGRTAFIAGFCFKREDEE
jgi:hypothetical protein